MRQSTSVPSLVRNAAYTSISADPFPSSSSSTHSYQSRHPAMSVAAAAHWTTTYDAPARAPATAAVTVCPSTRSVSGSTVSVGGGSNGAPGSNARAAVTAPMPLGSVPAAMTHCTTRQSRVPVDESSSVYTRMVSVAFPFASIWGNWRRLESQPSMPRPAVHCSTPTKPFAPQPLSSTVISWPSTRSVSGVAATAGSAPAGDATPTIASVAIAEATTAHAASTTRVRPVIGIIDPHLRSAPTSWTDPTGQLIPVWDDRRPRPVPCDARPRPGLA